MSEELNNEAPVVETADPQDDNTQVSEGETQEVQEQSTDQSQRPSETDQERNWKAMREGREAEQLRNQELMKQNAELTSMMKEFVSAKTQNTEPEVEEDDSDIQTLGQTKKVIKREAEKIARNIVEQTMAKREHANAPQRLKQEHTDFDSVVSKENVDYLIKNEPEIAAILNDTKDPYKQGKVAYKFIKSLGLAKSDNVESMKQDASRNAAKPVSPNAVVGRNSVGDANMFAKGLTADLKKQLHQEMIDAIKRG